MGCTPIDRPRGGRVSTRYPARVAVTGRGNCLAEATRHARDRQHHLITGAIRCKSCKHPLRTATATNRAVRRNNTRSSPRAATSHSINGGNGGNSCGGGCAQHLDRRGACTRGAGATAATAATVAGQASTRRTLAGNRHTARMYDSATRAAVIAAVSGCIRGRGAWYYPVRRGTMRG